MTKGHKERSKQMNLREVFKTAVCTVAGAGAAYGSYQSSQDAMIGIFMGVGGGLAAYCLYDDVARFLRHPRL